jgi:hypothetical protein
MRARFCRDATTDRVTAIPASPAGPKGRAVASDYDSFGAAYTAETEDSLVNAYYERPAILDLAGAVAGRRILDAGCGSWTRAAAR